MQVEKEEVIHIAKLANLNLKDSEIEMYKKHLQDILNFANIVNNAGVENLKETISANDTYNVFRKDEILQTTSKEALLQNAQEVQDGMFKIPKVIN